MKFKLRLALLTLSRIGLATSADAQYIETMDPDGSRLDAWQMGQCL